MNVLIRVVVGIACAWKTPCGRLLDEELERVEHEVGPEPHVAAVAADRATARSRRRSAVRTRARGAVGADHQIGPAAARPAAVPRTRTAHRPPATSRRSCRIREQLAPAERREPVAARTRHDDRGGGCRCRSSATKPLGDLASSSPGRRARTRSASRPRTRPRSRTRRSARLRSNTVTSQSGAILRIRIEKYRPAGSAADDRDSHRPSHAEVGQVLVLEREPVDRRCASAPARRGRSAAAIGGRSSAHSALSSS